MPPRVLLVTADEDKAGEIRKFLKSSCSEEDFIQARTVQEAYDLFEAHFANLRLIFVSQQLPSDRDSDTAANFVIQAKRAGGKCLLIAMSPEEWEYLEGCRTYFSYDQLQSLIHNCLAFLRKV